MHRSKTSFTYIDHTPQLSLYPASLHSVETASCGKISPFSIALSIVKAVAIPYGKGFLFITNSEQQKSDNGLKTLGDD